MTVRENEDKVHEHRVLLISSDPELIAATGTFLKSHSGSWKSVQTFDRALVSGSDGKRCTLIIYDVRDAELDRLREIVSRFRLDVRYRSSSFLFVLPGSGVYDPVFHLGGEYIERPFDLCDFRLKVARCLSAHPERTGRIPCFPPEPVRNVQFDDFVQCCNRELRKAEEIQRSILPSKLPEHPLCVFAASYVPLETAAGDLFDIWEVRQGVFGLFIADVSGHGLSGAFLGSIVKMVLTDLRERTPAEVLTHVNRAIAPHLPEGWFVTALLARFQVDGGLLTVSRAGHPPALIYRARSCTVDVVLPQGLAIGFSPEARYESSTTTLEAGDKLLLYSDGFCDVRDATGHRVQSDKVRELFRDVAESRSMVACLEELRLWHERFREGGALKDDVTLVGLEFVGG